MEILSFIVNFMWISLAIWFFVFGVTGAMIGALFGGILLLFASAYVFLGILHKIAALRLWVAEWRLKRALGGEPNKPKQEGTNE